MKHIISLGQWELKQCDLPAQPGQMDIPSSVSGCKSEWIPIGEAQEVQEVRNAQKNQKQDGRDGHMTCSCRDGDAGSL